MLPRSHRSGFTLIELLIVIGIVAVLAVVVVLTLNPAELLKQSRDANRLAELNALNKALAIVETEATGVSFGSATTIYISIPDSSTTCANLGLPALPAGYSYGCAPTSTLRNTNGTGWVPVNFNQVSSGSPLPALPVDPVNSTSTGQYYTYFPGGSWELTALMESSKHRERGINDGDSYPSVVSIGSTHGITPGTRDYGLVGYWGFDDGSGTSAGDSSGNGNTATLINNPVWQPSSNCKVRGCLSFNGTSQSGDAGNGLSLRVTGQQITLMVWASPTDTSSDILITKGTAYRFNKDSTQRIRMLINGNEYVAPATALVPSGSYSHIAVTYDGAVRRVYLNGVEIGNSPMGTTLPDVAESVVLAVSNSGGNFFSGYLDEARIYNRTLSSTEIAAIYAATN